MAEPMDAAKAERFASRLLNTLNNGAMCLMISVGHRTGLSVSLAQGGEGLGAMWGEEKTHEFLREAGFRSIETHRLAHDIQNNWYVVRK